MVVDTVKNALVVPSTAVQPGPSGPYVYILAEGDVAKLRNVTTGFQDDHANLAVVSQGLSEGDQVVTTGFGRLSDGAKVRVVRGGDAEKSGDDSALTPSARGDDGLGGGPPGAGGDRHRRREGRKGAGSPPAAGAPQSGVTPSASPPAGPPPPPAQEKRTSP